MNKYYMKYGDGFIRVTKKAFFAYHQKYEKVEYYDFSKEANKIITCVNGQVLGIIEMGDKNE